MKKFKNLNSIEKMYSTTEKMIDSATNEDAKTSLRELQLQISETAKSVLTDAEYACFTGGYDKSGRLWQTY